MNRHKPRSRTSVRQLKGLFWKDGGPVAGVRIENECHSRGPGKGEEHILTLRRMARQAGMAAVTIFRETR